MKDRARCEEDLKKFQGEDPRSANLISTEERRYKNTRLSTRGIVLVVHTHIHTCRAP